ncbi:MAG TPA: DUF4175 family protein [Anaeromyxobacter sp.]
MSVAYGEIARVLGGARRRQVWIVLLAAAGFGAAAAVVCLLLGAAALGAGARGWVRGVALGGAALAASAAAGWAALRLLRTAWSDEAAARTVGAGEPALRSALVSSIELSRERADVQASGRFSVALLDAHVAWTAERARQVRLDQAVPARIARRGGVALLAALAVAGLAALGSGGALGKGFSRLLARAAAAAPSADPITGDIELTLRYPAYMRREPRTLSGTGGEIRAPKGTEVELRTRADRKVDQAEVEVTAEGDGGARPSSSLTPSPRPSPPASAGGEGGRRHLALSVKDGRDLAGKLLVEDAGSYRFRFLDRRGRAAAEGPPIPIAVEPDLAPEVRIVSPEREVEVDPAAVVRIEWQAEDDVGLAEVALVVTPPGGEERRRVLRAGADVRRDGGTVDLDLAPERLGEGEVLSYRIEAKDGDAISGPKTGASDTHRVKIYSEAEHRRQVLEKAKQLFDELVALLADRLETLAAGPVSTPDRLALAVQLDARTRQLHERMREVARELRRDRSAPRPVASALDNVAGSLRLAEQRVSGVRAPIAQLLRIRSQPDANLLGNMAAADGQLDAELEKGILYLEQLLDKQRAEDLVRLAKDLSKRRAELGDLLQKYRAAPSEAAKKELLARISRMKDRVKELLARMSETAKGFNDEHMNAEALAEMQKAKNLGGGLDEVEQKLAQGDVEGAMRALDQMASTLDKMLAGMQRTAGLPDEKARALMKEMLAFKDKLDQVKGEQEQTAKDTDAIRKKYQQQVAERSKKAEQKLKDLQRLAGEAKRDVDQAQPGVSYRAEPELDQSREALSDLERALGMRELQAAFETSLRAAPAVERLARFLEEDVPLAEQNPAYTRREPQLVREAQRHARDAVPKVREIRDELGRLFPDPRQLLGEGDQKKLDQLSQRQRELERQAGELQQKLSELAQQAPVFPPNAQGQLAESRGHMNQAAGQLGQAKNPQRGHGEQQLALDALSRFQKGLEDAARKGQGQGDGPGFPFPFADSGGEREGDGGDFNHEKVKIPGAEAHKVPEEFRRDLLEAMKQGTPERYRGDVQRYYEELVK